MSNVPSTSGGEVTTTGDLCSTCGHALVSHDAIGLRWCAATQLGVGHRQCICSDALSKVRVLAHY